MGFMDFAKNIGVLLFDSEKDAPEKIRKHILSNNPGIEDLQITVKDGVATINCKAQDKAAAEKTILMIGNVKGVSQVNYNIQEIKNNQDVEISQGGSQSAEGKKDAGPITDQRFYDIKSGDTLSAIAKKFYGDANAYNKIFEANKEVILDPDKIYPGQRIRIPVQAQP